MQKLGIVEVQYKGLPRKRYFRVDAMRVIMEMGGQEENAGNGKCSTTLTTGGEPREPLAVDEVNENNYKEQPIRTTVNNKHRGFTPPTLDEVKAYCDERNSSVDPEAFVDYYSSQGWKKANGQRVQDWKGCVRTWEKKDGRSKDAHARGTGRNDAAEYAALGYVGRSDATL